MEIVARPYQRDLTALIYSAWGIDPCSAQVYAAVANSIMRTNVLAVLPTGGGKTVVFAKVIKDHKGASCAIAHRQELVSQISLALAREGIRHKIIGPKSVVKLCVKIHMKKLGRSYFDPSALCAVAGVDTLIRRIDELTAWRNSVSLWVMDEAHHVLKENKWGIAVRMFPNARGLGVTATPCRADKKGLGRTNDGVFDVLCIGPGMRDLITMGYLTDYRIFGPQSDMDLSDVSIGESGDYSRDGLKKAARRSHIVGDVVAHYLRIAPGKLGITFATDVETATDIAKQFNLAGVPAAVVTADTPDDERVAVLQKFENREILQLVNVDLFGEGFDLPAIEVVSMARPTKSFPLYCQQFGRVLRLMIDDKLYPIWDTLTNEQRRAYIAASKKPVAIIIDHVNNVDPRLGGHGLPDAPRTWSLERGEKRGKSKPNDAVPIRVCPNPACTAAYERIFSACPYCGFKPEPTSRSGPEFVDGDLCELDINTLMALRGEVARVDMPIDSYRAELAHKHVPVIGQLANVKRHAKRQEAQAALRASIAWWAGYQRAINRSDSESYRRFFYTFGTDVLTAQTLGESDALELAARINDVIGKVAI